MNLHYQLVDVSLDFAAQRSQRLNPRPVGPRLAPLLGYGLALFLLLAGAYDGQRVL